MDNLSKRQRSLCMSRIKGKDTKPELVLKRLLRALGFRFKTHVTTLPGKPDIVFASHRLAIFVHGCYWHSHNCRRGRSTPKSNATFWKRKRGETKLRDRSNIRKLRRNGWKALVLWECQLDGKEYVLKKLHNFLGSASA